MGSTIGETPWARFEFLFEALDLEEAVQIYFARECPGMGS